MRFNFDPHPYLPAIAAPDNGVAVDMCCRPVIPTAARNPTTLQATTTIRSPRRFGPCLNSRSLTHYSLVLSHFSCAARALPPCLFPGHTFSSSALGPLLPQCGCGIVYSEPPTVPGSRSEHSSHRASLIGPTTRPLPLPVAYFCQITWSQVGLPAPEQRGVVNVKSCDKGSEAAGASMGTGVV